MSKLFFLTAFLVAMAAFFSTVEAKDKNAQAVADFVELVLHQGNFSVFDDFIAENFINYNLFSSGTGAQSSRDDFRTESIKLKQAFPDFRLDIDDIFEGEDGKVTVRGRMSGTHLGAIFLPYFSLSKTSSGALGAIPATNKTASNIPVMSIVRVDKRKWVERWNVSDYLTLFKQLGIL